VTGDPYRLQQVLLNLLSNALKFTETGSIQMIVSAPEVSPSSTLLQFCVADTGIGIPPESQPRIFESFEQADGSTTRKYGGTGLGLAICTRLVHLLGGSIWVESQPGSGSSFYFTARFARVPAPVASATAARR
jgi:signal transduction histidine kinase